MAKAKKDKEKSTYDREEMVENITCDILNGVSRYRILRKLDKDAYEGFESSKFSRSKKYDLIKEAYDNCKYDLGEKRDKMRELFMSRYEDILEEARDQNDRTNAINALKEMGKILGIYEPDKVDLSGNMTVDICFGLGGDDE